ncbi:hypothetical protein EV127DRAFT_508830 [Xylaria flabelliformis]|nr:hypothetical protein EV127DRAFT_508830 [Xylaria flabelliformis]
MMADLRIPRAVFFKQPDLARCMYFQLRQNYPEYGLEEDPTISFMNACNTMHYCYELDLALYREEIHDLAFILDNRNNAESKKQKAQLNIPFFRDSDQLGKAYMDRLISRSDVFQATNHATPKQESKQGRNIGPATSPGSPAKRPPISNDADVLVDATRRQSPEYAADNSRDRVHPEFGDLIQISRPRDVNPTKTSLAQSQHPKPKWDGYFIARDGETEYRIYSPEQGRVWLVEASWCNTMEGHSTNQKVSALDDSTKESYREREMRTRKLHYRPEALELYEKEMARNTPEVVLNFWGKSFDFHYGESSREKQEYLEVMDKFLDERNINK